MLGELDANRARAGAAIERAATRGAHLVVLPELCVSGYVFADVEEARACAEPLEGATFQGWRTLAGRHGLTIVGGICEQGADGALHNTAVVLDGHGLLAAHRKCHLWDREPEIFAAGALPPPVVDTRHGRIGVAVCYDSFFPETMRELALAGAEVIAVPMNSPAGDLALAATPIELSLAIAAAAVNRVFVVQADRAGRERGVDWAQASAIVDPDGRVLAGPLEGPAVLLAELALEHARDKSLGERNDVLADRRPELYGAGAEASRRWQAITPTNKETVP